MVKLYKYQSARFQQTSVEAFPPYMAIKYAIFRRLAFETEPRLPIHAGYLSDRGGVRVLFGGRFFQRMFFGPLFQFVCIYSVKEGGGP